MKKLLITLLFLGSLTHVIASHSETALAADSVQKGSMSNLVRIHQTGPQGGVIQPGTQGTQWKQIEPSSKAKTSHVNHHKGKSHLLGGKGGKQQMSLSLRGFNEKNRKKIIQFADKVREQQHQENKQAHSRIPVAAQAA